MKHEPSSKIASVAVLTVSDTRSLEDDRSGLVIVDGLIAMGHVVADRKLVRDDPSSIKLAVQEWVHTISIDVIMITGGTGPSHRDVTPQTIQPMLTCNMPGFGELFRMLSYKDVGPAAMLSRANAGWIDADGRRLPVFSLPGSPNAVQLAMDMLILPQLGHLLEVCCKEVKL